MKNIGNEQTNKRSNYSYDFNAFNPLIMDTEPNIYDYELDQIYNNENIKNIAITGIYGAGKSSVWETYKNRQEKLKVDEWKDGSVITVSLADFQDIYKLVTPTVEINNSNPLEKQIINQILYQIDSEKIPLSQFDLKLPKTIIRKNMQIVALILLIVGIWSIFAQEDIKRILDIIYQDLSMVSSLLPLFFIGIPIYFLFAWVLPKLKFKITKINIKGTEAKREDDAEGILNKSMHEVVYLILASDAHTLVFEDLDRYNDINLFIKLRELNFLVNKQSSKPVRFFYMVKDSMFESKDRTKFFDITLPIVPVINSENSKGKLLKSFEDIVEKDKKPSVDTLERIALYIDDMRILWAIRNEYEIYYHKIDMKKRGLDADKLFAMIVLKNIFPIEFDDLQINRGYVCGLFKQKDEYKENFLVQINDEIKTLREKVTRLDQMVATRKTDIMAMYMPTNIHSNFNTTQPMKDFLFEWSKEPSKAYNFQTGNTSGNRTFDFLNSQMLENDDYKKAVLEINDDDINKEIGTSISYIKLKNDEKESINLKPLAELLNELDHSQLRDFFNIKEYDKLIRNHYFPLIKFLILEGLIDESYKYYIGGFIESTLDISDEEYLMKIGIGERITPEFELSNPNIVIKKMNSYDFERESVFNYSLLNEMIRGMYKNQIQKTTKTILKKAEVDEFCKYLDLLADDVLNKFVILQLPERLDNLLSIAERNSICTELNNKIISMVYCNYKPKYNNLQNKDELVEYTEKNSGVLEIQRAQNNEDFIKGLTEAEIKFIDLSNLNLSKDMGLQLVNNNLYKVTYKNTKKLLDSITPQEQRQNSEKFLSIIQNEESLSELENAIKGNYESVIKEYLETTRESKIKLYNDEETTLFVLKSDVSPELKTEFLSRNSTKINNIGKVDNIELWDDIVKYKRLEYNESNIEKLEINKIDEDLIIFYLNDYYENSKPKTISVELADKLVNNNTISDSVFEDVLNHTNNRIDLLSKDLPNKRIDMLIDKDLLEVNKENLIEILNRDNVNLIQFLEDDVEESSDLMLDRSVLDKIAKNTAILIFNSKIFSEEVNVSIIENLEFEYSVFDLKNSSIQLQDYVLNQKWDKMDLDNIIDAPNEFWLWENFASIIEQEAVKEVILTKELSDVFIDKIVEIYNISDEFKTEIIAKKIDEKESLSKIPSWLSRVEGVKNIGTVFDYKHPMIETPNEEIIAKALERLNVISISDNGKINYRPTVMDALLGSADVE